MEEQFVPYELALKLKELGFDEKCLGFYYQAIETEWFDFRSGGNVIFNEGNPIILNYSGKIGLERDEIYLCKAPLWQQAFDWFREEKELLNHSTTHLQDIGEDGSLVESYGYRIMYNKDGYKCDVWEKLARFDTYEEARLACLEKLIEIVENKVS